MHDLAKNCASSAVRYFRIQNGVLLYQRTLVGFISWFRNNCWICLPKGKKLLHLRYLEDVPRTCLEETLKKYLKKNPRRIYALGSFRNINITQIWEKPKMHFFQDPQTPKHWNCNHIDLHFYVYGICKSSGLQSLTILFGVVKKIA